jgi:hypothetical protein
VAIGFCVKSGVNLARVISSEFNVGIWHPFGPHGRETAEEIISRKRTEIGVNGWTLWSFQYRRQEILEEWFRHLSNVRNPVVFCSMSLNAVDPASTGIPVEPRECLAYRSCGEIVWQTIPPGVKVRHPFRGKRKQASAFVIKQIIHPAEFDCPNVQWLSKGVWQESRLPTRGEYLIQRGGSQPMRAVRAFLELQPPYLAVVSAELAS